MFLDTEIPLWGNPILDSFSGFVSTPSVEFKGMFFQSSIELSPKI
ncbi:hypothetical protein RV06_GL002026 [Enterococcus haemoperoxidus]|nr:hypothetical protein RV06_GL002026 [Enterococcus haemoperoxidus]